MGAIILLPAGPKPQAGAPPVATHPVKDISLKRFLAERQHLAELNHDMTIRGIGVVQTLLVLGAGLYALLHISGHLAVSVRHLGLALFAAGVVLTLSRLGPSLFATQPDYDPEPCRAEWLDEYRDLTTHRAEMLSYSWAGAAALAGVVGILGIIASWT